MLSASWQSTENRNAQEIETKNKQRHKLHEQVRAKGWLADSTLIRMRWRAAPSSHFTFFSFLFYHLSFTLDANDKDTISSKSDELMNQIPVITQNKKTEEISKCKAFGKALIVALGIAASLFYYWIPICTNLSNIACYSLTFHFEVSITTS